MSTEDTAPPPQGRAPSPVRRRGTTYSRAQASQHIRSLDAQVESLQVAVEELSHHLQSQQQLIDAQARTIWQLSAAVNNVMHMERERSGRRDPYLYQGEIPPEVERTMWQDTVRNSRGEPSNGRS